MRLALYQPDIPQNAGALARLCACTKIPLDVIEPCGFTFNEAGFQRAGMDYLDRAAIVRHASWQEFVAQRDGRLILLTVKATLPYTEFGFLNTDILLLGRESAGVPDDVHAAADARIQVPMREGVRSLNVALAGAMVLGEALRQTDQFPKEFPS